MIHHGPILSKQIPAAVPTHNVLTDNRTESRDVSLSDSVVIGFQSDCSHFLQFR